MTMISEPATAVRLATTRSAIYWVNDSPGPCASTRQILSTMGPDVFVFQSAEDYTRFGRNDAAACLLLCLSIEECLRVQQLNLRAGGPPVVFICSQLDLEGAVKAVKAGAVDCLSSPIRPAALKNAIRLAFAEDTRVREHHARLTALRQRFGELSPRQQEVFPLVISGLKNKQAAWRLGISLVTLQVHRGLIMRKMAATSFAELVRMGSELGLTADVTVRDHANSSRTKKSHRGEFACLDISL